MTRRASLAATIAALFALMLVVSASEKIAEPTLHARIVQLEEQVQQLQLAAQVCSAQLALANKPNMDRDAKDKREKAEREMGCKAGADWDVVPPVCRAEKGAE